MQTLFGQQMLRGCQWIECQCRAHNIVHLIHFLIAHFDVSVQSGRKITEKADDHAFQLRVERHRNRLGFGCMAKRHPMIRSKFKRKHQLWCGTFIEIPREYCENRLRSLLVMQHVNFFAVDENLTVADFVVDFR